MYRLTAEQKFYVRTAIKMVDEIRKEGSIISIHFAPYLRHIEIHYCTTEFEVIVKEFNFREFNIMCNYIFLIKDDVYKKTEEE